MSASVVDNIIGKIKPVDPEEVISILSAYSEGVERMSKEVIKHTVDQVHRNSEIMMTWVQVTDPIKRIEVTQTWLLNSAKGYHSMLHRMMSVGHETIGHAVKRSKI